LLTGVSAAALALVAACGTQHGTSSPPRSGPSSSATGSWPAEPTAKPSVPECPEVPGVVDPSPCVSVGAEQNQQANQTFNSRIPLPAAVAAEAAPAVRRIQESLEKLTTAQRTSEADVQSALLAAGMQSADLVVLAGPSGASFGGYVLVNTRPPVCAWGTLSVRAIATPIVVDSGGITREGGCLPSAGGH
jgi:hypothetical protein